MPATVDPSAVDEYVAESSDQYRPQFHLTPPANWMNDPNGLVLAKSGYHAFYQHNPSANTWGNIVWGHARSDDLFRWVHKAPAITPPDAMAFSGSASTCDGALLGAPGREHLVVAYTAHNPQTHLEEQRIACSHDDGVSWRHISEQPVANRRQQHFRDPRLIWHGDSESWVLVITLAEEHRVVFYRSTDLQHWSEAGSFHSAEEAGVEWECPELVRLADPASDGQHVWLLKIDVSRGAVAGGSGGKYFLGDFDGTTFTARPILSATVSRDGFSAWLDYGMDFYAAQVVAGAHDNDRPVWFAWASNWLYARQTPTEGWRGCMSLPRQLFLKTHDDGYALCQQPLSSMDELRTEPLNLTPCAITDGRPGPEFTSHTSSYEVQCRFRNWTANDFGISVASGTDCETRIGVSPLESRVFVDRRRSGYVDFHDDFAALHSAPLTSRKTIELRIVFDRSIVEVFVNDGEIVLTSLVFPAADATGITFFAAGGRVELSSATYWPLELTRE